MKSTRDRSTRGWMRSEAVATLMAALLLAAPAMPQNSQTPPQQTTPPQIPLVSPRPPAGTPPPTPSQQQTNPAGQTVPAQGAPAQGAPVQGAPQGAPGAAQTAPAQTAPAQAEPAQVTGFDYMIPNASLTEFIDIIAKRLKINYILDPAVGKGSVSIYTYGDAKPLDLMTLLQTVLRVNGAAIVPVGDLYRIIPINKISVLPVPIQMNVDPKTLPDDERMILDLIFLKYATAKEIETLISPFLGEGASHSTYEAANLLILQDNARSMKRTMQLIDLFDSDTFAGQRVRLFETQYSRPSDMAKELETLFKGIAMSDKALTAVKFVPVDRINTLIAVAPNPGIFTEVKKWLEKLDVAVKQQAGEVTNYAYRLRYGRAETIAMAIMALYTGDTWGLSMLAAQSSMNTGLNGLGFGPPGYGGMGGGFGGGGFGGGGFGGGGFGGGGYGGYGPYGGGGYGGYGPYGGGGYGGYGPYGGGGYGYGGGLAGLAGGGVARDQTGQPLGAGGAAAAAAAANLPKIPRVVPNPLDNTLLIQGTPQEYEDIVKLLRQLDIPPRQVLIEAKLYTVDTTVGDAWGTSLNLTNNKATPSILTGTASSGGAILNFGLLQTKYRQLLALVEASENTGKSKQISAPTIIATDSVPATVNIGSSVPTLTSQGVIPGVTSGGSTPFYNTVSNVSTGVTLSITARVSPSGIVTLKIDQSVSAPEENTSSGINSPSFSSKSFNTLVTVDDGQMIAIGGGVTESDSTSSAGIPFLHRIPFLGAAFGKKSYSKSRSELVMFIVPHVIYNSDQLVEASDEVFGNLKKLKGLVKDEQ